MQIACPACHTRYSVPDTAIGAQGRTVRCAKCRHSWYQSGSEEAIEDEGVQAHSEAVPEGVAPEPTAEPAPEPASASANEAMGWDDAAPQPRGWADVGDTQTADPVASSETTAEELSEPFVSEPVEEIVEPEPVMEDEPAVQRSISAFAEPEPVDAEYEDLDRPSGVGRIVLICLVLLVLAAGAIYGAVRFFGAPDWLPVGQSTFAPASEALVLDFPADDQDRRELPNGRQLFAANGTITNTGSRTEHVPPVLVVLRDSQERIVYSWEMEPSRTELGPGESVKVSEMVTDVPPSARIVDIGWKPS